MGSNRNKQLKNTMKEGYFYGGYNNPCQTDDIRQLNGVLNNLRINKNHKEFIPIIDKKHKEFIRIARKTMNSLEKYLGPKNEDQVSKKIAARALSDLLTLASSLRITSDEKADNSKLETRVGSIRNNSTNLKQSARRCATLIPTGRKIAGLLMAAAGIATIIASSAIAFFSFGGALPISAPLAGVGVSLSAAGLITTFGPSGIKCNLNRAANIAEKIAEKINPANKIK